MMPRTLSIPTVLHRLSAVLLIAILLAVSSEPAAARRKRVVVRHGPHHRTTVVIHTGHPIRRPLPAVIVRPARVVVAVPVRPLFLAPVVWTATAITLPPRDRLIWEDSEVITEDEDWVDVTLGVNQRGGALYFKLDGKAQLNFAEVVFGNGDVQVVDFKDKTRKSGIYSLLNFRNGREVSYVRIVARSKSDETRITLLLDR
jgi:hypothetical protein